MFGMHKRALEYIRNTGYGATVEQFDDDHEPIGPQLREDLRKFITVNRFGKLDYTTEGMKLMVGE
jgi:hypothetical protein